MTSKQFETSDLGLAAALLTTGVRLRRINKTNPKRAVFEFESEKDIERIANNFWSSSLKVSAIRYFENTKLLKNRIYGGL